MQIGSFRNTTRKFKENEYKGFLNGKQIISNKVNNKRDGGFTMSWTEEQLQAIKRGANILVSAAAGSETCFN